MSGGIPGRELRPPSRGEQADAIGVVGRLAVILTITVVLVGAIAVSGVPGWTVTSFANGSMLAIAGVVAIRLIRHREIAS